MKITGRIVGANIDFRTGKPQITFEVNESNEFGTLVDELKDKDKLSIEVKPFRVKRSLDANAYCWVLIDKLAEKMGESKVAIYREYIKHIGGNSEIVCVKEKAAKRLCEGWQRNGLGWQTDTIPSKIKGCVNVVLYYGSSVYDTAQMSRLLDFVIYDCKEFGIPTETPDQIAEMKSRWGDG